MTQSAAPQDQTKPRIGCGADVEYDNGDAEVCGKPDRNDNTALCDDCYATSRSVSLPVEGARDGE